MSPMPPTAFFSTPLACAKARSCVTSSPSTWSNFSLGTTIKCASGAATEGRPFERGGEQRLADRPERYRPVADGSDQRLRRIPTPAPCGGVTHYHCRVCLAGSASLHQRHAARLDSSERPKPGQSRAHRRNGYEVQRSRVEDSAHGASGCDGNVTGCDPHRRTGGIELVFTKARDHGPVVLTAAIHVRADALTRIDCPGDVVRMPTDHAIAEAR